ncbi:MAG TPA: cadherin-like beta sandwich domain-containing protein [Candidatus Aphodocola excrementigallinarum]|uniref:Cadherin-like beta sandwich domain-containing protein n=1 Tax=Candidatus Aphodocola excrementigallinarum TaxID=2840670 RepID=A0A9D1LI01_9FIRM|nr:cadherin-like beta sandwich domain-containing protein [Candidatus Aphodocola excrementigallinarum]
MRRIKYLIITFLMVFCLFPICALATGSISVSTTNLNITKGGTATFSITANNAAGRIDISSSNSSVASVSSSSLFLDMQSGTITVKANQVGNTTIRVYATDVTTYDDEDLTGRTYTINVNVTEPVSDNNDNINNNTGGGSGNTSTNSNTNSNRNNSNKKTTTKNNLNLSSNNNLKELTIDDYDLVKIDDNNYTLVVTNNVTSINVKAVAEDEKSKITGTGNHDLKIGENTIEVIITAESGAQNKINIKITRKDGLYIEDLNEVLKDTSIDDINIIIDKNTKLSSSDIKKIKESGKKVNLNYYDNKNLIYSWILDGSKIKDVNELSMLITYTSNYYKEISELSNYADGLYLSFDQKKDFPAGLKIRLYVHDKFDDDSLLNLYYYSISSKKLELVKNKVKVQDGYIEVEIEKGSEYFLTMSDISISNQESFNYMNLLYLIPVVVIIVIIIIMIIIMKKRKNKDNKTKSLSLDDNVNTENGIENLSIEQDVEIDTLNDVKGEIDKVLNNNSESLNQSNDNSSK